MEREQKPVLIVEETRIYFFLHDRALACKLRARVRDLDGVASLVLPLVRDLVRLRLPDPRAGDLQLQRGQIDVARVANRVDLTKRVETIGLGNLVGDGRALLRRHRCRRTKHSDQQNTDHGNAARFRHCAASFGGSESICAFDDGEAFSVRRWSTPIVLCRAAQPGSEKKSRCKSWPNRTDLVPPGLDFPACGARLSVAVAR